MNAVYYTQDEPEFDEMSEASTIDAEEAQRDMEQLNEMLDGLWDLYVNEGDDAALDAMDGEQLDQLMEFYEL